MTRIIKKCIQAGIVITALAITACGGSNKAVIPENEGTISSPISLSFDTPYTGAISKFPIGESFYSFTPGVTGNYTISLTGVDSGVDLDWLLYEYDGGVVGVSVIDCVNDIASGEEICDVVLAMNTTYLLIVENYYEGNTSYILTLASP